MGLMSSPYVCIKTALLADETVRGDHTKVCNPFHWAKVVLNLPGGPGYDPQRPWVYRVREDGGVASDVPTYVDDMRTVGRSKEDCWQVGHAMACGYCWLGIQVSARKTRPPVRILGPGQGR
jgi:hypothetical protein